MTNTNTAAHDDVGIACDHCGATLTQGACYYIDVEESDLHADTVACATCWNDLYQAGEVWYAGVVRMTANPTARDQYLLDVFTTALEGGINYWSQCTDYHWCNDDGTEDYQGFYALIVVPAEDLTEAERANGTLSTYTTWNGTTAEAYGFRIDRTVMARGWRLGATTPVVDGETHHWQCNNGRPPLVITEDTEWDYDALDADAIVQYGLFGKGVFG